MPSHTTETTGPSGLARFFLQWVSTTVAVLVAAHLVPGVGYDRFQSLAVAALILGLLNAFVRPILFILSLPFVLITFGFGIVFVIGFINALFLWLAGRWVEGFDVRGFWPALFGGLVVGVVSSLLNRMFGANPTRTRTSTDSRPRPGRDRRSGPPDGNGPVIDV